MDELFKQLKGTPSREEAVAIATTGKIPVKFKDNNDKEYIILIKLIDEDDEYEIDLDYQACICIGRDAAWEKIKKIFVLDEGYEIDVRESCVIVEGVDISDRISLYKFTKHCEQIYREDINIDYYIDDILMKEEEESQATGFGNSGTILK